MLSEYKKLLKVVEEYVNEYQQGNMNGTRFRLDYIQTRYAWMKAEKEAGKEYNDSTDLEFKLYKLIDKLFYCAEDFEVGIPDPNGELKDKHKWITSEAELYQEVMKYYPEFKEIVEKMENE
jgi:hypothetical protein